MVMVWKVEEMARSTKTEILIWTARLATITIGYFLIGMLFFTTGSDVGIGPEIIEETVWRDNLCSYYRPVTDPIQVSCRKEFFV